MQLRMFSVVGEALNFSARRFETIMRMAWLPVVLLLMLDMSSVFATLSVSNGRLVGFPDLAAGATFSAAALAAKAALLQGLLQLSSSMWVIFGATTAINLILVASFMAPLIRYAGLGERPPPGAFRMPFGGDQVRFVVAGLLSFFVMSICVFVPVGAAAFYVIKYVIEALTATYAAFPNPESLHTITLVTAQDRLTESGEIWKFTLGAPLAAAAPFAIGLWIALVAHFHPKNRAVGSGAPSLLRRCFAALLGGGVVVAFFWMALLALVDEKTAASYSHYFALISLVFVIALYVSLRITPYQGVAVCRRSFSVAGTLKVTRGWNIARLFVVLLLVSMSVFIVQILINAYVFGFVASTVNLLYEATASATKLAHSGEVSPWVRPLFVWLWSFFRITINVLMAFFSYGVMAGLLGRLYRESERNGIESVEPPPWRYN